MSKRDDDQIDPELESDLGAEFDLRGDRLQQELAAAQEDAATHLEAAQRVQAEFENFRKRNLRDMEEIRKRAGQRIIEELLPILDNLERAIDHTVAGGDLEHLLKGVEMVYQQVTDVFGKEGVEMVDPFGELFDPSIHQAVGQREDVEVPEGTVVDVFQKGYLLGGRVVRPAAVVVSAGGPAPKE
ncbi:MAG: nucleotide exchange factor GrpE [Coriobacteriia bacterium]|nr:nucleotide exchange factor GrpE [Coriobacteriia bacterium]